MLIGIDEVGRGSWAGPLLVVAARKVLDLPKGLTDSKIVTRKKRELFFYDIKLACDLGEGWVEAAEIDALGLTKAMLLGVERALKAIEAKPREEIIIDGHINYCHKSFINSRCEIDADFNHPIVSAASVYAKVLRDNYMVKLAEDFPEYGFEKHVGYGTKYHRDMIALHGVCDIHRKSYKPLRSKNKP